VGSIPIARSGFFVLNLTIWGRNGTIKLMKKVALVAVSFLLTPTLLLFCILYFSFLGFERNHTELSSLLTSEIAYAALPGSENVLQGRVTEEDARVEKVRSFFHKYNSELEPYAQEVVDSADKYGLDFRLIPAIGMQESNLCKKAPKLSNNCWGFGIYGKKVTKFDSYPEAINTVTKTLAYDYKEKGLETPEQIMKKYTPSNNGAWADSVNHFMNQLQTSY
jgi:hypothetical protein